MFEHVTPVQEPLQQFESRVVFQDVKAAQVVEDLDRSEAIVRGVDVSGLGRGGGRLAADAWDKRSEDISA